MKKNFISNYFDNKSGEKLKNTITKNWDSTKDHIKILNIDNNSKRILEVGCGVGRILKEISKDKDLCVGFDASKSMIDEGKIYCQNIDNIKLYNCNGDGLLNYDDLSFDYAFSFITFQHIPNTNAVLKYISEMYRLLEFSGKINIQFLTNDEFPEKETWTYHNLDDIIFYMKKINFKNINKINAGRWTFINATK